MPFGIGRTGAGAGKAEFFPEGFSEAPLPVSRGDFSEFKAEIEAMYDAIASNNMAELRRLVDKHCICINGFVCPDCDDEDISWSFMNTGKMSPLHFAVFKKNREAAEILLDAGADVNASFHPELIGYVKFTPLHMAVKVKSMVLLNLLLDRGADPNGLVKAEDAGVASRSCGGSEHSLSYDCVTPLFLANTGFERAVSVLEERGANPSIESYTE